MGQVGQVEDGLRLLAEARTVLEANGQGDLLAEVYRLQGALLLQQAIPDVVQAEACFQQALHHCPQPARQILGTTGGAEPDVGYGSDRASARQSLTCWPQSTTGSPRALIQLISRRPKRCSQLWRDKAKLRSFCIPLAPQFPSPMERQDNPSLRVGIDVSRFV